MALWTDLMTTSKSKIAAQEEHPGALARIDASLAPMIEEAALAGGFLSLDASSELGDHVVSAQRFLGSS